MGWFLFKIDLHGGDSVPTHRGRNAAPARACRKPCYYWSIDFPLFVSFSAAVVAAAAACLPSSPLARWRRRRRRRQLRPLPPPSSLPDLCGVRQSSHLLLLLRGRRRAPRLFRAPAAWKSAHTRITKEFNLLRFARGR